MTNPMDAWHMLNALWAAATLVVLWGFLFFAWRLRDLLGWSKALQAELSMLQSTAGEYGLPVRNGAQVILDTCSRTLRSVSPDYRELKALPAYLRAIAACFHPDARKPELQIRVGAILEALNQSIDQFDTILQRPGVGRLRSVSLHTVLVAHHRYRRLTDSVIYQWFRRYRAAVGRFYILRFLLFLDPLILLVYLSRRLTHLVLIKYLMVDIYVFIGKAALKAYSEVEPFSMPEGNGDVEAFLKAAADLSIPEDSFQDPEIKAIRSRLVGFSAMLSSNPSIAQWRDSVVEAAEIIAAGHFPESAYPLEEAAIGPLVKSLQGWLSRINKGAAYPGLKLLYGLRLDGILRAKDLTYQSFPKSVQDTVRRVYRTYGAVRWPLKAYRMTKRFAPWKLSLELGWVVSKRAAIAYAFGRAFDAACEECSIIYRSSKQLRSPPHRRGKE